MTSPVMVKVMGFSDKERHSLNTLFRLSSRQIPSYQLWTLESVSQPHVALIDVDSYEATLELESPNFNPNLKVIAIGKAPRVCGKALRSSAASAKLIASWLRSRKMQSASPPPARTAQIAQN